jgi:hypothetical protein
MMKDAALQLHHRRCKPGHRPQRRGQPPCRSQSHLVASIGAAPSCEKPICDLAARQKHDRRRLQALGPFPAPPPPPAPATHACPPSGTPNPPAGPTSGGSGPKQLRGGWKCPRTPSQRPRYRRSAKSALGVGHKNPLRAVGLTMSVVFFVSLTHRPDVCGWFGRWGRLGLRHLGVPLVSARRG